VAPQTLTVQLQVSNRHPLQLHGVLFHAVTSTPGVAFYYFDYGDGVKALGDQPLAMHGYRHTGTFRAVAGVIDRAGRFASSAPVTIQVKDGIPPVVSIDSPRPGQRVRIGSAGLALSGHATDAGGLRSVQIAIQLVASARHFNTKGACIWYDGHVWLVLAGCTTPYFFDVPFSRGRWHFRIPAGATIPAGRYVVRMQATDRAGNVSHYYAVSLRTILPFELVR
jgi:hypothetical protein